MEERDCCYAEMSKNKIYEDSEVKTDAVPYQNRYEETRSGSEGLNQSGFEKGK